MQVWDENGGEEAGEARYTIVHTRHVTPSNSPNTTPAQSSTHALRPSSRTLGLLYRTLTSIFFLHLTIGSANLFPIPNSGNRKMGEDQLWVKTTTASWTARSSESEFQLTLCITHSSTLNNQKLREWIFGDVGKREYVVEVSCAGKTNSGRY